jgi:hypothetical protein
MSLRLWSLWAKRGAVGNAQRFPRQAARFAPGELSTNPQPRKRFRCDSSFRPGAPKPAGERGASRRCFMASPNGCWGL